MPNLKRRKDPDDDSDEDGSEEDISPPPLKKTAKQEDAADDAHDDTDTHPNNDNDAPPIPVTIISGFLGSGKTTLLQYILKSPDHGLKIAVIVNDMAELNIDGQTIQRTKKEVVKLQNGCICCTLRGDLIREIHALQLTGEYDYVLIESTGIAEPQQVAESFCVNPDTIELAGDSESMLWNSARLDTCVTVVDAVQFPDYINSLNRFQEVFRDGLDDAEKGEGEKSISELMVEQVEFANVILLNKVDLVSPQQLETARKLIESLNPKARVATGSYGKIDLHAILNSQLFNMQDAQESPGWLVGLKENGVTGAEGEADEYGVSSFVYRARKPFQPYRLHDFMEPLFCFAEDWNTSDTANNTTTKTTSSELDQKYGQILRSKGVCWIAGRDDHEIGWAQTGKILQLSATAAWYCKSPEEEWPEEEPLELIQSRFHDEDGNEYQYGDRRQEIVFIGTKLQPAAIREALDKALLTEEELGMHTMSVPIGAYPDPLHPILVPCDDSKTMFMMVRPGQNQNIRVYKGFKLTIQSLALNVTRDNIQKVQVWLDPSDSAPRGVLLATLRPNTFEQYSLSVDVLSCHSDEVDTNRLLRVTAVGGATANKRELMESCEVHVMAKVEPIPYSEANGDDDDTEHDGCTDGTCPMTE